MASRDRIIPIVVACPLFLQNLDTSVMATALPTIADALHVQPLHLNLAITAYLLSLAVFLPFLDDTSFLARMLGSIDLIFIWWMLSLSIGLGVLYRKRTGPIAITLLAVYVAIGVIIAAIKTASTGA